MIEDMTNLDAQHEYYSFAYQTGSDIWTHIACHVDVQSMLPTQENPLVLDIGCGRGAFMMHMIEERYRILGLDYVESVIDDINRKIKKEYLENYGRALCGNILTMPFQDAGFDILTDIGTFQHLNTHQQNLYVQEISRILKPGGYYLNVSLSANTKSLLGFKPKSSGILEGEKFGLPYHFFKNEDIAKIFVDEFSIIETKEHTYPSQSDPADSVTLLFTLMQKKER